MKIIKIIKNETQKFTTYLAYYLNNIKKEKRKIGYLKISKKDSSYKLDINGNDLSKELINSVMNIFIKLISDTDELL